MKQCPNCGGLMTQSVSWSPLELVRCPTCNFTCDKGHVDKITITHPDPVVEKIKAALAATRVDCGRLIFTDAKSKLSASEHIIRMQTLKGLIMDIAETYEKEKQIGKIKTHSYEGGGAGINPRAGTAGGGSV